MEVALDVSAGTGKSLETVTQAMGRALNGSAVALNRLVPALKNSKNPMKDLAAAFEGANEQASKQKTWERFEIILGNIKEMIGDILLPVLDDFSEWFTTAYPKIQEFFKNLKAAFDEPAVKQSFKDLNDALGRLGTTLRNLFGLAKSSGANDMITFLKTLADVFTVIANVIDRIVKGLKVAMPSLNALGLTGQGTQALAEFLVDNVQRPSLSQIVTPGSQLPTGPGTNNRSGNRTININVNSTNITPKQIVDKIKEAERQTGTRYLVR